MVRAARRGEVLRTRRRARWPNSGPKGIAIPGGARYWFEKSGDVELELLQFVSFDSSGGKPQRVNVEKHKDWMTDPYLRVYETTAAQ